MACCRVPLRRHACCTQQQYGCCYGWEHVGHVLRRFIKRSGAGCGACVWRSPQIGLIWRHSACKRPNADRTSTAVPLPALHARKPTESCFELPNVPAPAPQQQPRIVRPEPTNWQVQGRQSLEPVHHSLQPQHQVIRRLCCHAHAVQGLFCLVMVDPSGQPLPLEVTQPSQG